MTTVTAIRELDIIEVATEIVTEATSTCAAAPTPWFRAKSATPA